MVYKLSDQRAGERLNRSLNALAEVLRADPDFPTVTPLRFDAVPLEVSSSGSWLVTCWPYRQLTPLACPPTDRAHYAELGQLLRRLHGIEALDLDLYDPLVWARSRVADLARMVDVSTLRIELDALAARYQTAYPPACHVPVHGDVHWGQVARDETGRMVLLDFDTLSLGHPSVDCVPSAGWLRRTGPPPEDHLVALREGYGQPWPQQTPGQISVSAEIAVFSQLTWHLLNDQVPPRSA